MPRPFLIPLPCPLSLQPLCGLSLLRVRLKLHALPLQLALPAFMLQRMYWREEVATQLRLKYFRAQNKMLAHAEAVERKAREKANDAKKDEAKLSKEREAKRHVVPPPATITDAVALAQKA